MTGCAADQDDICVFMYAAWVPRSVSRSSSEPTRVIGRASRRGTYDRHSSPSERVRAQRIELLAAVRQVIAQDAALTVSSIAGARGLGRNTFYEHFTTVESAIAACVDECAECLLQAVKGSQEAPVVATPGERTRSLGFALHAYCRQSTDRWRVLVTHGAPRLTAVLRDAVTRVHGAYVVAGAGRVVLSPLTVAAAAGALLGMLTEAERRQSSEAEVAEELTVMLSRLLR